MTGYAEALELTNKRIDALQNFTVEGGQKLSKAVADLIEHVEIQTQIIEILVDKINAWEDISKVANHSN